MYCPRCGQEQISNETRFCSRCGFLLELVSQVLANGGVLPQLAELNKNKKLWTRKNGIKASVIWMIVMWLALTPLFAILGAPKELVAITAVLGFAGGVLLMLISFLFLDNELHLSNPQTANFTGGFAPQNLSGNIASLNALPPRQTQPAQSYAAPADAWKAPDTGEFVKPPSVTENTTKLLSKDE